MFDESFHSNPTKMYFIRPTTTNDQVRCPYDARSEHSVLLVSLFSARSTISVEARSMPISISRWSSNIKISSSISSFDRIVLPKLFYLIFRFAAKIDRWLLVDIDQSIRSLLFGGEKRRSSLFRRSDHSRQWTLRQIHTDSMDQTARTEIFDRRTSWTVDWFRQTVVSASVCFL